jgi:hypothetical protein
LSVGFGLAAWFPMVCAASVPRAVRLAWDYRFDAGPIVRLVGTGHFRRDGVGQGEL